MKTRLHFLQYSRQTRRGIALISVLAMVVLLTALVVAFMLRAGNERQASGFYKAESGAHALADTAINIVQAQINEATGQGINVAWASQPGALRTFDSSGNLLNIYRLYSATPSLTTSNTSDLANDVPSGSIWPAEPALWVDLNAPVNNDPAKAPINSHFPILDPRDPTDSTLKKTVAVDGFSINNAPVDTTGTTNFDANAVPNPAPMPVQWLYVLQDGTVIPPDGGSNGLQLTFASAKEPPTAANPIIGRIAFWTDDETCKVNINTAGGDGAMIPASASSTGKADASIIANNSYWAVPNFWSADDTNGGGSPPPPSLASSQPASGEYQRYPGHSATVALNEILSTLLYGASGTSIASDLFFNNTSASTPGITPRYSYGGSLGGTVNNNAVASGDGKTFSSTTASSVPFSALRLFPSVSELLFNPDRTPTPLNTSDATSRQRMETARFFLTAHSRAPELNLFGLPRIAMWPIPYQPNGGVNLSPVDTLIQFCSTIGSKAYYFVRQTGASPLSGAVDSTLDINIARNQSILTYLDNLTSTAIPGFGGNFSTKNYGSATGALIGENTQILNEIFDYVRITNVNDTTTQATVYGQTNWQGSGYGYNQIAPSLASSSALGWNTQGIGSYPRLVEVTLQFVAMGQGGSPNTLTPPLNNAVNCLPVNPSEMASSAVLFTAGDTSPTSSYTYAYVPIVAPAITTTYNDGNPYAAPGDTKQAGAPTSGFNTIAPVYNYSTGLKSGIPPDGTTAVQAFLLFTFVNPAESWLVYNPYIWVSVSGLGSFALNGHNLGFSDPCAMVCASGQDDEGGGRSGYIPMFCNTQHYTFTKTGTNPVSDNPFYSNIIPVNNSANMTFSGSSITIKVYDGPGGFPTYTTGTPSGCHLVQTYTVPFPASSTFPVPTIPSNPYGYGTTATPPINNPFPNTPASPNPNSNYPLISTISNPASYGTSSTAGTFPNAFGGSLDWIRPTIPYGTSSGITAYETTGPIMFMGNPSGAYNTDPGGPTGSSISFDRGTWWAGEQGPYNGMSMIGPGDVVESMVLSNTWSDPRLLAVNTVPASAFTTHPLWGKQFAHNLFYGMVQPLPGNGATSTNNWASWGYSATLTGARGSLAGDVVDTAAMSNNLSDPWAPPSAIDNSVPTTMSGAPPDWDSGEAAQADGPWINMADEGSAEYNANGINVPYYGNPVLPVATSALFSANREVSSPGMFGSLPTGIDPTGANPAGWQTLLFRPGPPNHPGMGTPTGGPPYTSPPDHLWMDLFWMPVAEPYAISEPFSTGGKVNLNYWIEPFTYIQRSTALRAAMATEKVAEVSLAQAGTYKTGNSGLGLTVGGTGAVRAYARYPIDLDTTMTQFYDKFNGTNTSGVNASTTPDIFRSASQICEEYLVPAPLTYNPTTGAALSTSQGLSYSSVSAFATDWYAKSPGNFAMVGDNLRELPYAHLYGKVTTKSNTFTVYYRVQTLKNAEPNTDAGQAQWDETKGSITGEYRGSTTLERYIDPNEQTSAGASVFPDYATATMPTTNLESYYQWRVVENRQFTP